MTEAEFRVFADRLHQFALTLSRKERLFLMAILARASSRGDSDVETDPSDPEWAISAELAFSIWQSMSSLGRSIGANPLPLPATET
ncbi:MAG TPA: hypothetical protein VKX16_14125 [Chloroflexota bacterium]|nr:hypothetical protein [Chloroflexota bacterium]